MYFPENDLALATGTAQYTPPPAAAQLHRAGEALPLWMAGAGDRFACSGINAHWLDDMCRTFDIKDVDVYDHRDTRLVASPWGWSAASRRALADTGYPMAQMPDDDALRRLRELSHRRTAAQLAVAVAARVPFAVAPPAVEAREAAEVDDFVRTHAPVIAKAPWSSSGRGLVRSRNMPPEVFLQQTAGIIRRQGSVMLEQELDKTSDFALLLEADGAGGLRRRGVSVFDTNARGGYTANALAAQAELTARVDAACGGRFEAIAEAVEHALPGILGDYRGPLGVDMLVAADGTIDAAVEVNLRHTMGFLALDFSRYLAEGAQGQLCVIPHPDAPAAGAIIDSHRLAGGMLDLVPWNPHFAFRASVFSKETQRQK